MRGDRVPSLDCIECGWRSSDEALGWRGYLVDLDEDGHEDDLVFCPKCAALEFDSQLRD